MNKQSNIKANYFEKNCLCFRSGMIEKAPINHPNPEQYYKDHCTCSEHSLSQIREYRDQDKQKSGNGIKKTNRSHQL